MKTIKKCLCLVLAVILLLPAGLSYTVESAPQGSLAASSGEAFSIRFEASAAMAPGSYFQMQLLVNLTTDTGSKSITGDVYKCHDNGKVMERKLASEEDLLQTLKDEFGICLE